MGTSPARAVCAARRTWRGVGVLPLLACLLFAAPTLLDARPEPLSAGAHDKVAGLEQREPEVVVYTRAAGRPYAVDEHGGEDSDPATLTNPDAPVRRKLISLTTPVGTKFFHQPLVNCLTYNSTNMTLYPSLYPACCTLVPSDCASRCEAVPTCTGFKFAWFMNSQPAPSSVPPVAAGQQWTWCLLMDWFDISTCVAELRWDPESNATGVPVDVRPQDIWDTYYRGSNKTLPEAATWGLFYTAWAAVAALQPPPPPGNSTPSSALDVPLTAGLTVGLGVPACLAAGALFLFALLRCGLLPGLAHPSGGKQVEELVELGADGLVLRKPDTSRTYDVFVSYRRQHLKVADAVHSKLVLTGLRVFFDRSGGMAGRPFETELFKAVRDSPVFAPIITLEDISFWSKHDPTKADYTLAEFLIAMHWARQGRVQLVFPLLVGEWSESATQGGERDYLLRNPAFKKYRDALPTIVPAATVAMVNSMFAEVEGKAAALDPMLQKATVRDIIVGYGLGNHAAAAAAAAAAGTGEAPAGVKEALATNGVRGILEMDAVMLYGPDEQAGLVLRHRYAEACLNALYGKRHH